MENDDLENGVTEHKIVRTGEISKETERMYLTFSWWLLHEGWKEVAGRVRAAVEEVVGPYVHSLRGLSSAADLCFAEWRSNRQLRTGICLESCRRFEPRSICRMTVPSTSQSYPTRKSKIPDDFSQFRPFSLPDDPVSRIPHPLIRRTPTIILLLRNPRTAPSTPERNV